MNSDQISSLVRTILKLASALLIAHGMQNTATALNAPDVVGAIVLALSLLWSHFNHSAPPPSSGGSFKAGGTPVLLLALSVMSASILLTTGCQSTPQAVTYQAAATSTVTVETALKAYDVFAGQGKTTPAENAAVKAAFEKYQAAFALVCDAGAVYASTSNTNAPAATEALQTAIQNANQTITDFVNLVTSFGVKL